MKIIALALLSFGVVLAVVSHNFILRLAGRVA